MGRYQGSRAAADVAENRLCAAMTLAKARLWSAEV